MKKSADKSEQVQREILRLLTSWYAKNLGVEPTNITLTLLENQMTSPFGARQEAGGRRQKGKAAPQLGLVAPALRPEKNIHLGTPTRSAMFPAIDSESHAFRQGKNLLPSALCPLPSLIKRLQLVD